MKKFVLLIAAGLMLGGAAFAQEENGALGFGIVSESNNSGIASKNVRFNLFLDAGAKLFGPLYYGFELQGDVKKMDEKSMNVKQTDMKAFGLGDGDWVIFYQTSNYSTTYTLWDLDLSPRGYLSFDLGSKIQLLGFAGLNYNWQTLEVTTKVKSGTPTIDGQQRKAGDEIVKSNSNEGTFDLLAGFRVSIGAFYLDYTRFLKPDDVGNYSFNQFNKNRWGLGINLRF